MIVYSLRQLTFLVVRKVGGREERIEGYKWIDRRGRQRYCINTDYTTSLYTTPGTLIKICSRKKSVKRWNLRQRSLYYMPNNGIPLMGFKFFNYTCLTVFVSLSEPNPIKTLQRGGFALRKV